MKADERDFSEYLSMVRRRWKLAAGAGGAVLLAFILYAYGSTPIYEGVATIFVDRPLIPDTTAATYPEEQLVAVTQRVLSTQNVTGIIDKFGLYPDARETAPIEDLVIGFRTNTVVTPSTVTTSTARGTETRSVPFESGVSLMAYMMVVPLQPSPSCFLMAATRPLPRSVFPPCLGSVACLSPSRTMIWPPWPRLSSKVQPCLANHRLNSLAVMKSARQH